jgi:hypothetical protein
MAVLTSGIPCLEDFWLRTSIFHEITSTIFLPCSRRLDRQSWLAWDVRFSSFEQNFSQLEDFNLFRIWSPVTQSCHHAASKAWWPEASKSQIHTWNLPRIPGWHWANWNLYYRSLIFLGSRLGDDPQIVDRSRIESGIGIRSVSIDNRSI